MPEQATKCTPRQMKYYRVYRQWPDVGPELPPITRIDLAASLLVAVIVYALLYISQ